jgi:vacuolar-type H+-ATPase subunit H
MENVNTLDNLLQIEAKAASLVNDAQSEADRRIHDSEEKNHRAYEERYRVEAQRQEAALQKIREKTKIQYQEELEKYREELSKVEINTGRFSALLNEYLAGQG